MLNNLILNLKFYRIVFELSNKKEPNFQCEYILKICVPSDDLNLIVNSDDELNLHRLLALRSYFNELEQRCSS